MKRLFVLFFILIVADYAYSQKSTQQPYQPARILKVINDNWTFNYFSEEKPAKDAELPAFDDSTWPSVSVPHTWSTFETTGEIHPFIRSASEADNPYWWNGWGWYRKRFTVNPQYSAKKVFVEFEGVMKYCKVWINGKLVGDHKGGYGAFDFDITDKINQGKENILVVAVSSRKNDQFKIPPMASADFNVYGGISHDVTIVLKDKLYIPMQGSASHEGGTYITTPGLNENEGSVRVQTWVQNDNSTAKNCVLSSSLTDSQGRVLQTVKAKAVITPGQLYRFDQTFKPIKKPSLWSPESANLYKIVSEVSDDANITDSYSSTFGFRWFRWNYVENALYLNGKKTILSGGVRYHEFPWLGGAVPKWLTESDIKDAVENLSFNFISTGHYPAEAYVYDLTDRYGLITVVESPNVSDQDFSKEVQDLQLKEMIRQNRNHPSILFWGMGFETNRAADSKSAWTEDTTRLITAYKVSGGTAGIHAKLNETNLPLKGTSLPLTGNTSTSIVTYSDFGADKEFTNSQLQHIDPSGLADIYRIPKYTYYIWQSYNSAKPNVFIQSHSWTAENIGQKKDIVVYSNCDKVELKVNGITKGNQSPDNTSSQTFTFKDITVENGTVSVVATKMGKTVASQVAMAGVPIKIMLKCSNNKISALKSSVAVITAEITDAAGNRVSGAGNSLWWTIKGPATLIGPQSFEAELNESGKMEGTGYNDTPVSNLVRSTGKPGKITVLVSASGLQSGFTEITAEQYIADNKFITEPALNDVLRRPISKPSLNTYRLEEIPSEILPFTTDIRLTQSSSAIYSGEMRNLIFKANPSVDTTSIEFSVLIRLLSVHLNNSKGVITADDFNFNAGHFNNSRLISGYVNATKLPPLFKETLRKYYAELLIVKGSERNAGDEMNWLNWIPSGGTVIVSQDGSVPIWPKGTLTTPKSSLDELITAVYPAFAKYNPEARERALTFISKMNPYVKVKRQTATSGEDVNNITYVAERGKPVLIPLIKFITE